MFSSLGQWERQYLQAVQGATFPLMSPFAMSSRASVSSLLRGSSFSKILSFSLICSISVMPDRMTVTPGRDCRNLKASSTGSIPGLVFLILSRSAGAIFASIPPRRGSMTQTGILYELRRSSLLLAPWKL